MLILDRESDAKALCPSCRYPLLGLHGFDGVSSADNHDLKEEKYLAIPIFYIAAGLLRTLTQQSRRRKVARLRKEILPRAPFSQICPHCLTVVERGL